MMHHVDWRHQFPATQHFFSKLSTSVLYLNSRSWHLQQFLNIQKNVSKHLGVLWYAQETNDFNRDDNSRWQNHNQNLEYIVHDFRIDSFGPLNNSENRQQAEQGVLVTSIYWLQVILYWFAIKVDMKVNHYFCYITEKNAQKSHYKQLPKSCLFFSTAWAYQRAGRIW